MRAARYILLRIPRKSRALGQKFYKDSPQFKGIISALISSSTYGMIPLFTLPLMKKGFHSDSILFYRFSIAASIIFMMMVFRRISFKINFKEFTTLFFLSILSNTCSLLFFLAFKYLGGGITTTLHFIYPIFVSLIMAAFYKEKLSITGIFAMIISILGVAILSLGKSQQQINMKGVVIALIAAAFYAMFLVFATKSNVKDMKLLKFTFYIQVIGIIYLFLMIQLSGSLQSFPKDYSSIVNLLLLALIPTIISILTLVDAVRKIGPTMTSILGAFEPITAIIIGILVFSEPFTENIALGLIIIIGAVILMIASKKIKKGKRFKQGKRKLKKV